MKEMSKIWNLAVAKANCKQLTEDAFYKVGQEFINMTKKRYPREQILKYMNEIWVSVYPFFKRG